jgi:hypothetical protein
VGRRPLTRFDFLHDGWPDAVQRVASLRVPRRLHAAAATLAAVLSALAVGTAFEAVRTRDAAALEARQQARVEAARMRLAAANLELREVAKLRETGRRLRAIRSSGVRVVARLARLGNLVPRGAWLTSIEAEGDGFGIEGEAVDVRALDRTLANFVADREAGETRLLRMGRLARAPRPSLVTFALHVGEGG